MSNVASVINHFSTSNEGFQTTAGSSVASGASTVSLTSTAGLTNGTIFVGIIEPGETKQQVFTGVVSTGTNSITGVVWTRGSNVLHAAGVTVVDYVTGTDHNMMTKGILVQHNQDGTHSNVTATTLTTSSNATIGGTLSVGAVPLTSIVPTGMVTPYAGAAAPTSWLICDGTSYLRATYPALFSAIGTTYGAADGTHFNVPDLKGRTVFGVDAGHGEFTPLGKTGGQTDVMAHNHTVYGNTAVGGGNSLQDKTGGNNSGNAYTTSTTGTGVNNLNPYISLNYIIKT